MCFMRDCRVCANGMTDAYSKYKSATGGTEDSSTGLLKISSSQYNKLETLNFNIGGVRPAHFPRPHADS